VRRAIEAVERADWEAEAEPRLEFDPMLVSPRMLALLADAGLLDG
jgi:hypothetical protein